MTQPGQSTILCLPR